jgi:hypothetical protein
MWFSEINLTYDSDLGFDDESDDISAGLAALVGVSSYVRDGETIVGGVGDVALEYQELGWKRVGVDKNSLT